MFAIIFLLLMLAGVSYYIAFKLYGGFKVFFPKLRFWWMLTGVSAIIIFMILGFMRSMLPVGKEIKNVLGFLSGYSMGIMLYLLLFTLLAEIIVLLMKLAKMPIVTKKLFKGYVTIGVLALTMFVSVFGFINALTIDHVTYEVKLQGKKDISDLNVVLISDLHLGAIGSEMKLPHIVEEINSLNPDIVCIAGDVFDSDYEAIYNVDKVIKALSDIKSTYGVYACLGNHDAGKTYYDMVDLLEKTNIKLLRDEYEVIDNRFVIVGRLDKSPIGGIDAKRQEFSKIFKEEDSTLPVIVMDHNPSRINEYGTEADLILCGHTHKGQVFPANLITDMIYDVDYGYYQKDENSPQVIVTSGVHGWGMPMRVGSDCEIVSVKFICE